MDRPLNITAFDHPNPAIGEPGAARLESLSKREREVLAALPTGVTSHQLGSILHISPRTVEAHRQNIMNKLGIHTRDGLVRFILDSQGETPASHAPDTPRHPTDPDAPRPRPA